MSVLKAHAEMEMAKFDNLSPEFRALVREYGLMPSNGETIESYLKWARFREKNMKGYYL